MHTTFIQRTQAQTKRGLGSVSKPASDLSSVPDSATTSVQALNVRQALRSISISASGLDLGVDKVTHRPQMFTIDFRYLASCLHFSNVRP